MNNNSIEFMMVKDNKHFNKMGVIGSRTFTNYKYMKEILDSFSFSEIVSGGAKGADSLARRYAEEKNIPITEILPEWDKYGKSAGFKRNKLIIDQSDAIVAFWDGVSRGTAHSISLARKNGKDVHIFWKE